MKKHVQKKLAKYLIFKNGKALTKLYCKSDVILLADVFEKFVSTEEYGIFLLCCVSLSG